MGISRPSRRPVVPCLPSTPESIRPLSEEEFPGAADFSGRDGGLLSAEGIGVGHGPEGQAGQVLDVSSRSPLACGLHHPIANPSDHLPVEPLAHSPLTYGAYASGHRSTRP